MANDNETVANVHDDMLQVVADEFGFVTMAQSDFVDYAERFAAAHKREMMRNKSLLRKAGELCVGLMNKMSAQHEEIKKLRGLVVSLTSALLRATVLRCVEADSGIPCKDLLDDDSCGAENCKSMCGRWRELIARAKKEVTK